MPSWFQGAKHGHVMRRQRPSHSTKFTHSQRLGYLPPWERTHPRSSSFNQFQQRSSVSRQRAPKSEQTQAQCGRWQHRLVILGGGSGVKIVCTKGSGFHNSLETKNCEQRTRTCNLREKRQTRAHASANDVYTVLYRERVMHMHMQTQINRFK